MTLRWTPAHFFNSCDGEVAEAGMLRYFINTEKQDEKQGGDRHVAYCFAGDYTWRTMESLGQGTEFTTPIEVKLACERHRATGKWEAEHLSQVPE